MKWKQRNGQRIEDSLIMKFQLKKVEFCNLSQGVKNFVGTNIETMFEDIIYKTVPKDKLK